MSFLNGNADYENWLRTQCDVAEDGLRQKHERMAESPFKFLRATYFRWAKRIEKLCPQLAGAPAVLSVGDAHLENFGTWRDAEGRLVWGVNDFDDAAVMPYPFDLVRLCASARLAGGLSLKVRDAAGAILAGYRKGLVSPSPSVLDAQAAWLRPFVEEPEAARRKFWKDLKELPDADPPAEVVEEFALCLPPDARSVRYAARIKGGGSLGRPRFVAIAEWCGGPIVREAKALVPSGWDWAHGRQPEDGPRFLELAQGRYRAPDPFLRLRGGYIFRRLSPGSRKLDFNAGLPGPLEGLLLNAMGFDLGSIHAADPDQRKIVRHLDSLPENWLHGAAKDAASAVEKDFKKWRNAVEDAGKNH